LQNDQDALNTAKQQRVYLEAMLEQERTSQATGRFRTDQTGLSAPTELAAIDHQLSTLRAQLAELSSKYTDSYPDVLRLKDQIAKTELEKQKLIAASKSKNAGAKQSNDETVSGDASDPTLSAAMRQLQGQLQANQLEIKNRESSIESLKQRIDEYQGRL